MNPNIVISNFWDKIVNKFEYIALCTFISIFAFFYYRNYFSYIFLVLSALIGCLIFIFIDRYSPTNTPSFSFKPYYSEKSRPFLLALSILYFFFFGLSLLELLNGFYTKTVLYYIYISLCASLVAIEILFVKTKKEGSFNLIKSFLLVLNITLSNQILYPLGIGLPDLVHHISMVESIVNSGYILGGRYQYFPCHHILAATNILLCNSNLKMTYLYLGGFIVCLGLIFVFIIGNKFVNLQFGLFAALFYTCLDYLIMYGSHPVHQSYNYFLSIVLFSVILYIQKNRKPEFIFLYILLITTMVFTHHLSAMINLVILSSLIFVEIIQKIHDHYYQFEYFNLARLFVVVLFGQWMYYSNRMDSFIGMLIAYKDAFRESSKNVISTTAYDQISINTIFLNTIGSDLLIIFSVIGFFYFMKNKNFFYRAVIISSISLSMLLGIGVVFKQVGLLPDRLYPFLQLFGFVFLASGGVIELINNLPSKNNKWKLVPIVIGVMFLSFFSCSSTIAGFETSPFVGDDLAYYKLYPTYQETFFTKWSDSNIPTSSLNDLSDILTVEGILDLQKVSDLHFIVFNKFSLITGFSVSTGGHMGQYKFIKINENEVSKLVVFDKYYDNNMVELYYNK